MKKRKRSKMLENRKIAGLLFAILNLTISTLFTVLLYRALLLEMELSVEKYLITIVLMSACSYAGAVIARAILHYWEKRERNQVFIYRALFTNLIYAGLVVLGYISYLFETYPLFPENVETLSGIENSIIVRIFVLKTIVYLLSDQTAQYLTLRRRR